ncbi:MAG TPA: 30S ribosomal protein S16 [Planctomycetaceae bacterium]|nr:30S ribosomal protein S16 [Planctomycetaceae bacterium]
MKKFGRRHRPFFRICAIDQRAPRNGRVLEELGTYDPMVAETDARAKLDGERVRYWLGVGAQPSDKVGVLIKKYGPDGTHLKQQAEALQRLAVARRRPEPPTVMPRQAATPSAASTDGEVETTADQTPAAEE